MANNPHPDRNVHYMRETWGTTSLITDYWSNPQPKQEMLREIANDGLTPKKHDLKKQSELHERIRNDEDYDDWEYGTEPIPLNEF